MDKFLFSKKIKTLRLKKGISQSALANEIGITKQALSNYEAGKNEPTLYTLMKIADYFDCSIDSLVSNESSAFDIPTITIDLLQEELKLIQEDINKLTNRFINLAKIINEISNNNSQNLLNDKAFLNKYEKYLYEPIEILTADFYGAIPCGDPIECSNESYETIDIPLIEPLKENTEYFVLEANGDSMDEFIDDGEYLVIEKTNACYNGDIVVALVNGDNTLKEFYSTSSHLILKPRSSNPIHEEQIYPFPTDIKIQGKLICKLSDLNDTYEKILKLKNTL